MPGAIAGLTVMAMPQWQGSPTPTAHRLQDGAASLAAMIPASRRVRVDISPGAGAEREGVLALDVLAENLRAARTALAGAEAATPITVGGDCAVDLAPIEAALARHGEELTVVWFDAHADLNTPESSPSGAFHGMILRTLLGDGPRELLPHRALQPAQVILAGSRSLDPGERAFIDSSGIPLVGVDQLATPDLLVRTVAARGRGPVHVHIDLDVLDPAAFGEVGTPEPDGLTPDRLVSAVRALADRFPLAGLTLTEYEKGEDHAPAVLEQVVEGVVSAFL